MLWLSAFTLAHSITLALVVFGVVGLPRGFVEPAIALSIAYVGLENLLRRGQELRFRAALTFGFRLLHGLVLRGGARRGGATTRAAVAGTRRVLGCGLVWAVLRIG